MFTHWKLSYYLGKYYHAKAPMQTIKAYAKQFNQWIGPLDAEMLAGLAFANAYAEGKIDESRITAEGFAAIAAGLNGSIAGLEAAGANDPKIQAQIQFLQDAEARIWPYMLAYPELAEGLSRRALTGERY